MSVDFPLKVSFELLAKLAIPAPVYRYRCALQMGLCVFKEQTGGVLIEGRFVLKPRPPDFLLIQNKGKIKELTSGNGFKKALSKVIAAFAEMKFGCGVLEELSLCLSDDTVALFCFFVFLEYHCGDHE